ncbi:MAG TPA: ABC transporter permease [Gaiellaceae bacterium]|nr:ABC transporter permease [Gaiellaceae bacterium]
MTTIAHPALQASRRILGTPTVGPFIALLLAMAFFSLKSENFLQGQNLSLVLQQVIVVGVLAIGQTFVILTAGIDLSCGTVMAFGQIVMTKLAVANGMNPLLAITLGILACVAFGLLNGALVTGFKLPAFIVTLGTLNIAFALTHVYSNDETYSELPSELLFFGRTFTIGNTDVTYGVVVMFALYAIAWFALTQTAWGRHVYTVGDNAEAGRLMGIKVNRVLLSVYVLAGLTYGIAALLLVGRTELGDPNAGQTTENLDAITAVVLGGTSLFGGRGSVIGTLIGAVVVGVFRNGLTLIGVEVVWQYFVTGVLVILAVAVDQLTHRNRA